MPTAHLQGFAVCSRGATRHNDSMPDLTALQRICGLLERGEIDRWHFVEQCTRQIAIDIGCSRAAVRLLVNGERGPALRSMAVYDAATDAMVCVPEMTGEDVTPYFEALLHDGSVLAADCRTHPATIGFARDYLLPENVHSLLDVSFSVNGVLYGCFSCEQVGATQAWTPQQLTLLRQITARASLALMHTITTQIDTAPGALWESSTPNRLMTMPVSLDGDR